MNNGVKISFKFLIYIIILAIYRQAFESVKRLIITSFGLLPPLTDSRQHKCERVTAPTPPHLCCRKCDHSFGTSRRPHSAGLAVLTTGRRAGSSLLRLKGAGNWCVSHIRTNVMLARHFTNASRGHPFTVTQLSPPPAHPTT